MGTKNNPGQFDCYGKADPDEPMFVLLGRDRFASTLVRVWAILAGRAGEDEVKVAEALACAQAMDEHRQKIGRKTIWQDDLLNSRPRADEHASVTEGILIAATSGLDQHPDDYNSTCNCDECRSCE